MVQYLDLPVTAYPSDELGVGGLGGGQAGDGVDGDGPPFLLAVQGPDPAGDADGLGGVGEGEPGGDGGGFEGAVFFAAVTPVALLAAGRDVAPGQVLDLGVQGGLVLLHGERKVRAAPVHVVRGSALGMEGIGRDDSAVQVQAVEQRDDHRDLIRFRADLGLSSDDAPLAGQGGQQVHLAAVTVPGAPDGLAVHPDGDQRRLAAASEIPGGAGSLHQPGPGHRVQSCGVSPGDHPPDRAF
jgi:hypothetical protein